MASPSSSFRPGKHCSKCPSPHYRLQYFFRLLYLQLALSLSLIHHTSSPLNLHPFPQASSTHLSHLISVFLLTDFFSFLHSAHTMNSICALSSLSRKACFLFYKLDSCIHLCFPSHFFLSLRRPQGPGSISRVSHSQCLLFCGSFASLSLNKQTNEPKQNNNKTNGGKELL